MYFCTRILAKRVQLRGTVLMNTCVDSVLPTTVHDNLVISLWRLVVGHVNHRFNLKDKHIKTGVFYVEHNLSFVWMQWGAMFSIQFFKCFIWRTEWRQWIVRQKLVLNEWGTYYILLSFEQRDRQPKWIKVQIGAKRYHSQVLFVTWTECKG